MWTSNRRENDQHTDWVSEQRGLKFLPNKFVLVIPALSLQFCPNIQILFCIKTISHSTGSLCPESLVMALFIVYNSKTVFPSMPWNFLPSTFQHQGQVGAGRSWGLEGQVYLLELEIVSSRKNTLLHNGFWLNANNPIERGFPAGSVVKHLPASAADVSSVSGLGRSPGEGNGNPLRYSSLENPMDREAWQAVVSGVAKELDTT